jgi:hypothetical protein
MSKKIITAQQAQCIDLSKPTMYWVITVKIIMFIIAQGTKTTNITTAQQAQHINISKNLK